MCLLLNGIRACSHWKNFNLLTGLSYTAAHNTGHFPEVHGVFEYSLWIIWRSSKEGLLFAGFCTPLPSSSSLINLLLTVWSLMMYTILCNESKLVTVCANGKSQDLTTVCELPRSLSHSRHLTFPWITNLKTGC